MKWEDLGEVTVGKDGGAEKNRFKKKFPAAEVVIFRLAKIKNWWNANPGGFKVSAGARGQIQGVRHRDRGVVHCVRDKTIISHVFVGGGAAEGQAGRNVHAVEKQPDVIVADAISAKRTDVEA